MEAKIERKFKWFWAWQDDKEEAWLEEMSRQGLHLKATGLPGIYDFERGEPGDYAYRLDYNTSHKDRAYYLQLFQDAGWEHCGRLGGWDYFRKPRKSGELMEIFSDRESKILKFNRLLTILVIFFPILLMLLTRDRRESDIAIYEIGRMLGLVLMVLYSLAMIKIIQRIGRLKKG